MRSLRTASSSARRQTRKRGQSELAFETTSDGVAQREAQWLVGIKLARTANQQRSDIGPDAPVARFVRIGQGRAANRMAQTHAIQLARIRVQDGFDVAQALAPGQLREGHHPELLRAVEGTHAPIAVVALDDPRHARPRHELHKLREQRLAKVHAEAPRPSSSATYRRIGIRQSNRHQPNIGCRPRQHYTSGPALPTQPDTSGLKRKFTLAPFHRLSAVPAQAGIQSNDALAVSRRWWPDATGSRRAPG